MKEKGKGQLNEEEGRGIIKGRKVEDHRKTKIKLKKKKRLDIYIKKEKKLRGDTLPLTRRIMATFGKIYVETDGRVISEQRGKNYSSGGTRVENLVRLYLRDSQLMALTAKVRV